jgi:hypothetical protein
MSLHATKTILPICTNCSRRKNNILPILCKFRDYDFLRTYDFVWYDHGIYFFSKFMGTIEKFENRILKLPIFARNLAQFSQSISIIQIDTKFALAVYFQKIYSLLILVLIFFEL